MRMTFYHWESKVEEESCHFLLSFSQKILIPTRPTANFKMSKNCCCFRSYNDGSKRMCDKIFQLLPQAYVVSTVFLTLGSGSRSCRGCTRRPMSSPLSSRPRKVSLRSCERLPPQACVVPPVFSTPGSGSRSCRGCPLAVFFFSLQLI